MKIAMNALLAGTVLLTGAAAVTPHADAAMTSAQKTEANKLFYEMQNLQKEMSGIKGAIAERQAKIDRIKAEMTAEMNGKISRTNLDYNAQIKETKSRYAQEIAYVNKDYDKLAASLKAAKITAAQKASETARLEQHRKSDIARLTATRDGKVKELELTRNHIVNLTRAEWNDRISKMLTAETARNITPLKKMLTEKTNAFKAKEARYNALMKL